MMKYNKFFPATLRSPDGGRAEEERRDKGRKQWNNEEMEIEMEPATCRPATAPGRLDVLLAEISH